MYSLLALTSNMNKKRVGFYGTGGWRTVAKLEKKRGCKILDAPPWHIVYDFLVFTTLRVHKARLRVWIVAV